jgi:hypothetical protein
MSLWTTPLSWAGILLIFVAWFLHGALRPVRDYYVLKGQFFHVLDKAPWRKEFRTLYRGFTDYHAAKTAFDKHESYHWWMVLADPNPQAANPEVIHNLFMVSARSKQQAIARLKSEKHRDKELLHETPGSSLMRNRTLWAEFDREKSSL